jgi:hypothetical protein
VPEAVLACREAELALSRLGFDVCAPLGDLVPREVVDVGTVRQVLERLAARDHDVSGLHPWDVQLLIGAQLAELEEVLVDAQVGKLLGDIGEVGEQPVGRECAELAVEPADDADLALSRLLLCPDLVVERTWLGADELDRAIEVGEDLVPHRLGLFGRNELARDHDEVARGCTAARVVGPGARAEDQCQRSDDAQRAPGTQSVARSHLGLPPLSVTVSLG